MSYELSKDFLHCIIRPRSVETQSTTFWLAQGSLTRMYSKRGGGMTWGSTPTRNCTAVPSSWTRKAEPHGAYGHQPDVSAPGPGCCCTFPWLTLGTFLPSSLLCCENESECWLTEEALVAPLTEGHRNCFGVRDLSGFSHKSWLRGSLDQSFLIGTGWELGPDQPVWWRAGLGMVECLLASLASIHQMPKVLPTPGWYTDHQKCLKTLSHLCRERQ